jgi:hypothetical protein
MLMKMVCRIERRYPVAIALLSGTVDHTAIVDAVVALRGVLADQPVALVLDLGQLQSVEASTCKAVAELARDAGQWPGTWFAIGDASPAARQELARYDGFDVLGSTTEAVATAERMPVPPLVTVELPPERTAPASCREVVAETWHQWGRARGEKLVQLLASELVTNAVVHARTRTRGWWPGPRVARTSFPRGILVGACCCWRRSPTTGVVRRPATGRRPGLPSP